MTEIAALDANFGAEILGVDLNRDLDDTLMGVLTDALYTHQVIVIRDQTLDRDTYLNFGRQWGNPIPHVLDHMRMQDYPEMMTVGNTEKRDRDGLIRNGAALWHTDQSYEKVPASATMLYSIKAPSVGGETQFCNMTKAWTSLDATARDRAANLVVAHKYGHGKSRPGELAVNPIINKNQDDRVPPVYHDMVMKHPVCGNEALYALGHGAYAIRDMDDATAERTIDELRDHALQEQFIYRHKYRPGDVVVWDTLQTMHSATPIDIPQSEQEERLLWRISVRDKPRIFVDS